MQRPIPMVKGGRLDLSGREGDPIIVGTPAWYNWLEYQTAFLFADLSGSFLAHRTGSSQTEWKASRFRLGKLSHVSLGHSVALTLSRLQQVALSLASGNEPAESVDVSTAEPTAPQIPVSRPAIPADPLSSLMRTKLARPRSSSDVIPRTHLLERLNASLGGKVTLVCAPAGFGKTTLVVEWVQTCDCLTAWLGLDEADNELAVFVHLLTAALQTVLPEAFGGTASLINAPQYPHQLKWRPCSRATWPMCRKTSCWCSTIIISSTTVTCSCSSTC